MRGVLINGSPLNTICFETISVAEGLFFTSKFSQEVFFESNKAEVEKMLQLMTKYKINLTPIETSNAIE